MEPRIATLLGNSSAVSHPALQPPQSTPAPRPLPVEPFPVGDDVRSHNIPQRSEYAESAVYVSARSQLPSLQPRQKSGVPIAEVLNDETPAANGVSQPQLLPAAGSAPSFSGRLSDILLDPALDRPTKRRKVDGQTAISTVSANENSLFTLPKLPQLPKKTTKRPRIPPLLQGLHQPPPLPPEGRLFPPITGEGGGFRRDIGERVPIRSPLGEDKSQNKDDEETASFGSATATHSKLEQDDPPLPVQDKENQSQGSNDLGTDKDKNNAKETRKRNKWSEQETKDLLHGVSKFGIGNWKKILQCPDFNFNQRTAVDLKDRFRTCCPGEGLKLRKPRSRREAQRRADEEAKSSEHAPNSEETSSQEAPDVELAARSKPTRKPRGDTHRKGPAELAELGIDKPFFKSSRRQRREFTEQDDDNLLKGFEKYGPVWHSMRDDAELGFSTRHATDLRDRFRIRFPDKYARAGYKLKPKDELMLKEKEGASSQPPNTTAGSSQSPDAPRGGKERPPRNASAKAAAPGPAISALRPHAIPQPVSSFRSMFDEFDDAVSEEEGDGSQSPITLDRGILAWADGNPSQAITSAGSASIPAATSHPGDLGFHFFHGTEGGHINPLATLKLHNTATSTNASAATSNPLVISALQNSHALQASHNLTSVPASTAPIAVAPASKQAINSLLQTPNLPTIVFPHVPAASARSAMHNLPPPADLLSGLDLDARPEPQNPNFVLDDGTNVGFALPTTAYASTSTLAPLMGSGLAGGNARGLLALDRALLDEPLGERSVLNSSI